MRTAPFVLAAACFALAACGEEPKPVAPAAPAVDPTWPKLDYAVLDSVPSNYTVSNCPVCGKPIRGTGKAPYVIAYGGYAVAFDDKECIRGFASDPEGIIRAKINPKAVFDHGVKENR